MSLYQRKLTAGNTDWFYHDRFGMFIHFGLYALPAKHEWYLSRENITEEKYQEYLRYFNPDMFDAKEWARTAKEAGMKYAVITTKHHEGFCLFDTQYTDYKITNTPFGRDLIREYVDAFRAEGLKVGFYYSLLDWHHPDFTIDRVHPSRRLPNYAELNVGRDMHRYAEYMRNQITELLTNYGKIDIIWTDFSYGDLPNNPDPILSKGKGPEDWEADKLIALIRSLQPGIMINSRAGLEQDFVTPEQYQPDSWPADRTTGELLTWEACQTFSGSWGYYRDEMNWKSPQMLVEMLIKTVSCGGNLLMNVGPCARGYFDKRASDALAEYGKWMKYNCRSIYGCTKAEECFEAPQGTVLTESDDGKRLYIHLLSYPFGTLRMKNMADRIAYAQFLNDASEIKYKVGEIKAGLNDHMTVEQTADEVVFKLPTVKPDCLVPVIEVYLK